MTTDQLKTFVFAGLEDKSKEVNLSEVLHALDQAQTYLIRLLDWRLIPEMLQSLEQDLDATGKAKFDAPEALERPSNLLELISVQWEAENYIEFLHDTAVLMGSEILPLSSFLASINQTTDLLSSDAGSTILLNRAIGTGWATEKLNLITYKIVPLPLATNDCDLNEKWQQHMIELALADLWLKLGNAEMSAYYNKKFFERMGGSQQPERNVAK